MMIILLVMKRAVGSFCIMLKPPMLPGSHSEGGAKLPYRVHKCQRDGFWNSLLYTMDQLQLAMKSSLGCNNSRGRSSAAAV